MNAIEAMSGVSERPRELIITTQNIDADCVQATVEDSGIGIASDTIDKIFDSFYTTKPGGMGMDSSLAGPFFSPMEAGSGPQARTRQAQCSTLLFQSTAKKDHMRELRDPEAVIAIVDALS